MNYLILIILFLSLSFYGHANSAKIGNEKNSHPPGISETLTSLGKQLRGQLGQLESLVSKNYKGIENYKDAEEVLINPHHMASILLNSKESYLFLSSKNLCTFFHLLDQGEARSSIPKLKEYLIVDIVYRDKKKETALTSVGDYLKYQYQNRCFENKETVKMFLSSYIKKTFELLETKSPESINQCYEQFNQFIARNDAIHICRINSLKMTEDQTKEGIKKNLDFIKPTQHIYFSSICSNLFSKNNFCEIYLKNSYWDKVITKEKDPAPLNTLCRGVLKKFIINSSEHMNCIKEIKQNPQICHFNNSIIHPALSPRPNCDDISKALLIGKTHFSKEDSTGKILNEGLVNSTRIINHFYPTPEYLNNVDDRDSHLYSIKQFMTLTLNKSFYPIWNFSLCYKDPLEEEKSCTPYFYGDDKNDPRSETSIISKILARTKGTNINGKCQIVEKNKYNPNYLSFKRGCFLIYKEKKCSALSCPKKIMLNNVEIKDIEYKEGLLFHYYPTDRNSQHYAIQTILKEELKLSQLPIKTNTSLKKINSPNNAIIHGIGCAEDIYPSFFPQKFLNGCTPLPFIIDGYLYEYEKDLVILRTAIDDIYSPRIFPWHQIYTAVKNYSDNIPMREWSLYEIKL